MARFYLTATGTRKTPATCQGDEESGIRSHTRGWNKGIAVHGYIDPVDGVEKFDVYKTGGSNDPIALELLFTVADRDETPAG